MDSPLASAQLSGEIRFRPVALPPFALPPPAAAAPVLDSLGETPSYLVAPPGWGKSTLLAIWADGAIKRGQTVAWLRLGAAHSEPGRLFGDIVAALSRAGLVVGSGIATLRRQNNPALRMLFPALLLDEFSARDISATLVIDDVEQLDNGAAARLLGELGASPESGLKLVVLGRRLPAPLLEEVPNGAVFPEVFTHDKLRYTAQSLQTYYSLVTGTEDPPMPISDLIDASDGWIGPIAHVSHHHQKFRAGSRPTKRQIEEILDDYVRAKFLAVRSRAARHSLFQLAALGQFGIDDVRSLSRTPALLDAFQDARDREFLLEPSSASVPGKLQLNRTLCESLRRIFQEEAPDKKRQWHKYAFRFLSRGDVSQENLLEHALAAGLTDEAAGIVSSISQDLFSRGKIKELLDSVEGLPMAVVDRFPDILLNQVWALEGKLSFDEAEQVLKRIRGRLKTLQKTKRISAAKFLSLEGRIKHREMMLSLFQDDLPRVREQATQWLDTYKSSGANLYDEATTWSCLALATRHAGDLNSATPILERAESLYARTDAQLGKIYHCCISGIIHGDLGKWQSASRSFQLAVELAQSLGDTRSTLESMAIVGQMEIRYELNELEGLNAQIGEILPCLQSFALPDLFGVAHVLRLKMAERGPTGTFRTVAQEAQDFAQRYGYPRISVAIENEILRQAALPPSVGQVVRIARDGRDIETLPFVAGIVSDTLKSAPPPFRLASKRGLTLESLGLHEKFARAALLAGREDEGLLQEASAALEAISRVLDAGGAFRPLLKINLLRVGLHGRLGTTAKAAEVLGATARLANSHGFGRTVYDELSWLWPTLQLLRDQATRLVGTRDLDRFFAACNKFMQSKAGPATMVASVSENLLTPREAEVLRAMGAGLSDSEIAQHLKIRITTVRWHIRHIYQKLGVRRRLAAVRMAENAGLI